LNADLIQRVATKLIVPFIVLFALYVQFHGESSPGGGFQAGVIVAAAVILVSITFGQSVARKIVPRWLIERMIPLGALLYAGTGIVSLINGANFLDYSVLAHDSVHGHEYGIIIVEIGVLVTVAGTMIAMFYAFIERGR
jgi:multicomponent Na+:H+ antiporter subunit B